MAGFAHRANEPIRPGTDASTDSTAGRHQATQGVDTREVSREAPGTTPKGEVPERDVYRFDVV